ncbi:MAG TPA: hypothetical protein ENJ82_16910, partial [Bacteroidetes bacterium]|nr:hypothetical protein [Bacteroidota bacterium]
MFQSKLTKAVSRLNAWELRHLLDFVHSPFHNKNQKVSNLFEQLIAEAPLFAPENLQRTVIFAQIFGQKNYQEQKFKDLLSLCMKTLRAFLAQIHLRNDEVAIGLALLETLQNRGWDHEFSKASQQLEKSLSKSDDKLHVTRLKTLLYQEIRINFLSTLHDRQAKDSLQEFSEQLDTFYLLSKLKYSTEMANRQNVIAQTFDFGLLSHVIQYLEQHPTLFKNHSDLQIYYLIYSCVTTEDQETFTALTQALQSHASHFPKPERRELYTYATNFCIQQLNKGRPSYLNTLLDIYKWALEDETFLEEGWLSHWNYKNIVSASLKAGEFVWCENFIESYKPKVEPGERENAYTYNLACLHFEQQNYRQALRHLQHV